MSAGTPSISLARWEDLSALVRQGELASLDAQFARFLADRAASAAEPVALAAALASRAVREGHVCIDLQGIAGQPLLGGAVEGPDMVRFRDALLASGLVGEPGAFTPLVLDGARLYLHRQWRYEVELAASLRERAAGEVAADDRRLASALERWFPRREEGLDRQKLAAAVAATRSLAVISGGPGTGKTTTVVRALAVMLELAGDTPLRIALAAPTGKAAARLHEAMRAARSGLALPSEIDRRLPAEATTLHRLLGTIPGRVHFRHGRDNPLPLDVLVVDEASMLDLALAAKVVAALPASARLVLVGDRGQLASVEAGAVLASICEGAQGFSRKVAARLSRIVGAPVPAAANGLGPLADAVVFLEHSYRFDAAGGLGRLARAVRDGDASAALDLLASGASGVRWIADGDRGVLVHAMADHHAPLLVDARAGRGPEVAFARLGAFGVLAAHREGTLGARGLNVSIQSALRRRGLVPVQREWYPGRPVMVTRNDYSLKLYNGDAGVALVEAQGEDPAIWFPGPDGAPRRFSPRRVPECETMFALTVHKSQGSEFDEVVVVLPEAMSPVLSRELVYTAITRARRAVTLAASAEVLRAAIARRVERDSGLAERLS